MSLRVGRSNLDCVRRLEGGAVIGDGHWAPLLQLAWHLPLHCVWRGPEVAVQQPRLTLSRVSTRHVIGLRAADWTPQAKFNFDFNFPRLFLTMRRDN